MKVYALQDFDQAPEVIEVALPEPLEGEVRVRVHAASVNGFDLAVAAGYLRGAMEHRFPVVLGKDFAGVIDALGSGVDGFAVGDRVFGVVSKAVLGDGSIGEYVTVPAAMGIAKLPEGIGFTEAAALGLAGTAAFDAISAAGDLKGTTVLVVGATGGVGQQAIQLAVTAGAEVIGTASSAEGVDLITRLGASAILYNSEATGDLETQLATLHLGGVNVVLHFAGDPLALAPLVKRGGKFISTMVQNPADVPAPGVEVVSIYASPTADTLSRIAQRHAEEHTTVTVQRVYELDQAGRAFGDFASGTLGKLVIAID
ncbi:NADPH:quinone reductase [Rathayibacter caricis DSM 15933]|uniref:NADPH:quinone reductase n=1 Tax=Rathayibacter caricis DSM 15933 TaxID=1328867 RepID=A0A2T4UQV8_9MICO|nr:NADP-dependent oxidoreductase [Rathayibacter caricis]PTL71911.1 NADPH:quinone reductase [Rathayibacter caricis DSM 15933]